jgi:OOP family OmpA-OmpF porin
MNKQISAVVLVAGALGGSGAALAQETGWYLGGSLGQSKIKIDRAKDSADLTAAGLGNAGITGTKETDTAWKVFGGYRINRHFAVEGAYINLGKFSESTTVTSINGVAVAPVALTVDVKTKNGFYASAVGIVPLGSQFSLFGKLGVYTIKTEATATASSGGRTASSSGSDRNEDLMFGVGASYDFTKEIAARAEWERFRKVGGSNSVDLGDVSVLSLGIVYKF